MIDPQKHSEHRGIIEGILRFIPGFRGYLEKDYRQESDYLTRKWMADRLEQSKRSLDDYIIGLVDAGLVDRLTPCDRVKTRLDGLILKMRGSVRGYSGFFDYVKVKKDLLDQVYEHDTSMIRDVEELAATIEQLAGKPDVSEATPTDLLRQIDEVDRKFAKRGDLLNGLGE